MNSIELILNAKRVRVAVKSRNRGSPRDEDLRRVGMPKKNVIKATSRQCHIGGYTLGVLYVSLVFCPSMITSRPRTGIVIVHFQCLV